MHTCGCETIVIGVTDYLESDKLLTLFTREHGKLRGIARGARRSSRRFGGALELFARLDVQLVLHEGLSTLREADVVTVYRGIRSDLFKICWAGYACELVEQLAPEKLPNPRLYRLLTAYLERLDSAPVASADRRFYEINLLNILGYRPAIDHCSVCGTDIPAGTAARVADAEGALLCTDCNRTGRRISARAVLFLDKALQAGRFGTISATPQDLDEIGPLLDAAIGAHLPRPLKSLAFLRELL